MFELELSKLECIGLQDYQWTVTIIRGDRWIASPIALGFDFVYLCILYIMNMKILWVRKGMALFLSPSPRTS